MEPIPEHLLSLLSPETIRRYLDENGWTLLVERPRQIAQYGKVCGARQAAILLPLYDGFTDYVPSLTRALDQAARVDGYSVQDLIKKIIRGNP